ncbi:hypothetical protein K458DRAFT_487689 [Lentithecium fluviatile CBS 122367]|uniref:Uncharacterized protein n=1 Tax=Lentithecium fluviatile CBS 122367 TaxID=1168545 RepID=A0A6G1J1Y5_9PLEO|nr:hypothetical protein K458DRAFT_487689 [Lentithecium fluviatile CBS 122367]
MPSTALATRSCSTPSDFHSIYLAQAPTLKLDVAYLDRLILDEPPEQSPTMRLSTHTPITNLVLLLPTAALILAAAPPSATPIPLPNDCSAYPRWNATSNTAGPFTVVADSTGSSIDGNPASVESFTNDGKDRYGFVRPGPFLHLHRTPIPVPVSQSWVPILTRDEMEQITIPKGAPRLGGFQNLTLRCTTSSTNASQSKPQSQSQLQIQVRSSWVNVYITGQENWQAAFSFGLETSGAPGIPVQAYHHIGADGIEGKDVYFGARGRTGWAFKYNWGGNAGEYYLVRWIGEGKGLTRRGEGTKEGLEKRQGEFPVLDDRDWVGLLRVVG